MRKVIFTTWEDGELSCDCTPEALDAFFTSYRAKNGEKYRSKGSMFQRIREIDNGM